MVILTWCFALSLGVAAAGIAQEAEKRSEAHDESHRENPGAGMLGSYPATREATGTSWQPDSTPMEGVHFEGAGFDMMLHGFLDVGYLDDPEPRGESEAFTTGMILFGGRRTMGNGALGFRFMGSVEPVMGREGYPLLLQTGETADGQVPLLDRQHPHDVLMEVAMTYSHLAPRDSSFFIYLAPIGEPAIGPPAFMHRASNGENPLAPITHHWFDSTHITHGVATFGWVAANRVKIEASIFNGREPDENRWDVDSLRLDSYAIRFTANPTSHWSVQGSFAELNQPEQLHQGIDFIRFTASATYNRPRQRGNWATTVAWGRNKRERTALTVDPTAVLTHTHGARTGSVVILPVLTQNALLLESDLRFHDAHGVFARFEWVEKDELFPPGNPRHSALFNVGKLNAGYTYDFVRVPWLALSAGAAGSLHFLPRELDGVYGERPASLYAFFRARLR